MAYYDNFSIVRNWTPNSTMFNGLYRSGTTLSQTGYSGSSVLFDGNTGLVQMNLPAIANNFPGQGSYIIFGKIDSSILNDSISHWLMKFKTDTISAASVNSDYVDCFKDSGNNALGWQYNDDSQSAKYATTPLNNTRWFSLGSTWSIANGLRLYFNGIQVGSNYSVVSGQFTKPFDFRSMTIGAQSNAVAGNAWKGYLQNCAMWNTELTSSDMYSIGKII